LQAAARRRKLDLSAYPNLARFLSLKQDYFSQEIDSDQLFQELDLLDTAIRQNLYTNQAERELDELYRRLDVIEKLLNISAASKDLNEFRAHRPDFNVRVFMDFIKRQDTTGEYLLDPAVYRLDEYLESVEKFYRLADERSQHFVANLYQKMEARNEKLALMITGGFHTQEVLQEMQNRDISYVSITPCLTRRDIVNPYFSLLRNKQMPLEKLLSKNQEIMAVQTACPDLPGIETNQVVPISRIKSITQRTFAKMLGLLFKNTTVVTLHAQGIKTEDIPGNLEEILGIYPANDHTLRLDTEAFLRENTNILNRLGKLPFLAIPMQAGNEDLTTIAYPEDSIAPRPDLMDPAMQTMDINGSKYYYYNTRNISDLVELLVKNQKSPSLLFLPEMSWWNMLGFWGQIARLAWGLAKEGRVFKMLASARDAIKQVKWAPAMKSLKNKHTSLMVLLISSTIILAANKYETLEEKIKRAGMEPTEELINKIKLEFTPDEELEVLKIAGEIKEFINGGKIKEIGGEKITDEIIIEIAEYRLKIEKQGKDMGLNISGLATYLVFMFPHAGQCIEVLQSAKGIKDKYGIPEDEALNIVGRYSEAKWEQKIKQWMLQNAKFEKIQKYFPEEALKIQEAANEIVEKHGLPFQSAVDIAARTPVGKREKIIRTLERWQRGTISKGVLPIPEEFFVKKLKINAWLYDNYIAPLWEEVVFTGVPIVIGMLSPPLFVPAFLAFRLVFILLHLFGARAPDGQALVQSNWHKSRTGIMKAAKAIISQLALPTLISTAVIILVSPTLTGLALAIVIHLLVNNLLQPLINYGLEKIGTEFRFGKGLLLTGRGVSQGGDSGFLSGIIDEAKKYDEKSENQNNPIRIFMELSGLKESHEELDDNLAALLEEYLITIFNVQNFEKNTLIYASKIKELLYQHSRDSYGINQIQAILVRMAAWRVNLGKINVNEFKGFSDPVKTKVSLVLLSAALPGLGDISKINSSVHGLYREFSRRGLEISIKIVLFEKDKKKSRHMIDNLKSKYPALEFINLEERSNKIAAGSEIIKNTDMIISLVRPAVEAMEIDEKQAMPRVGIILGEYQDPLNIESKNRSMPIYRIITGFGDNAMGFFINPSIEKLYQSVTKLAGAERSRARREILEAMLGEIGSAVDGRQEVVAPKIKDIIAQAESSSRWGSVYMHDLGMKYLEALDYYNNRIARQRESYTIFTSFGKETRLYSDENEYTKLIKSVKEKKLDIEFIDLSEDVNKINKVDFDKKVIRVVNLGMRSEEVYNRLKALTDLPLGTTGDESLLTSLTLRKPFLYETVDWKLDFFNGLIESILKLKAPQDKKDEIVKILTGFTSGANPDEIAAVFDPDSPLKELFEQMGDSVSQNDLFPILGDRLWQYLRVAFHFEKMLEDYPLEEKHENIPAAAPDSSSAIIDAEELPDSEVRLGKQSASVIKAKIRPVQWKKIDDLIEYIWAENQKGNFPEGINLSAYPKKHGTFAIYYLIKDIREKIGYAGKISPRHLCPKINNIIGQPKYYKKEIVTLDRFLILVAFLNDKLNAEELINYGNSSGEGLARLVREVEMPGSIYANMQGINIGHLTGWLNSPSKKGQNPRRIWR
jgi:hypothetical protein